MFVPPAIYNSSHSFVNTTLFLLKILILSIYLRVVLYLLWTVDMYVTDNSFECIWYFKFIFQACAVIKQRWGTDL